MLDIVRVGSRNSRGFRRLPCPDTCALINSFILGVWSKKTHANGPRQLLQRGEACQDKLAKFPFLAAERGFGDAIGVYGNVLDSQGAVISGAKVILPHVSTNHAPGN